MADPDDKTSLERDTRQDLTHPDDPPVVARLVVEIRSDGTRTVARGAMEDATVGTTVSMRAEGTTPLALALSLARSMMQLPAFARTATRALLTGRKKDK